MSLKTLSNKLSQDMYQQCSKCLFDTKIGDVSFNNEGVCNYCELIEKIANDYGTGSEKGLKKLDKILNEIKSAGKNKKYDCICVYR